MRPYDAGALSIALAPVRGWAHAVAITDASGAWVDVTPFFRSVRWSEDRDGGAAGGTLRLRREARLDGVLTSLAPLMGSSPANAGGPLVNPFRGVRVVSTPHAVGEAPDAAFAVEVFRGLIDDPSWGGRASVLDVGIRDLAARLQDAIILKEQVYGSEDGTPIQTVLQQLIADSGFPEDGSGDFTVAVLGDPQGWSLKPYTQARGGSVWDALRALALQMGWDFRYWRHPDGTYRPTLLDPARDVDATDVVLTTSNLRDIGRLKLNGTDVRNYGELTYRDAARDEPVTITLSDYGSIAAFGRRPFGLNEDAASNIDTPAEAQQFLAAAVADLATPYVEGDATLPYLPWLQLGDVLQFPTGTVYFDAAQKFGIVGLTHEITVSPTGELAQATTPALRGRPIGAYQAWLDLLRKQATDDATSGLPRPIIGPLLGEATCEEGESGDGACWLFVQLDANTDTIDIFTATSYEAPVPTPTLDIAHHAWTIRRQEGRKASGANWATWVLFDTNADAYRKTYARPQGATGKVGTPKTHVAKAVDRFAATLGAVTTLEVARDGRDNVLTFAMEASTSDYALFLHVWRNGIVIDTIAWTAAGTYRDYDVPANREYEYWLQAFTHNGVSGARSGPFARTTRPDPTAPDPDAPPDPVLPPGEPGGPPEGMPGGDTKVGTPYLTLTPGVGVGGTAPVMTVEIVPRYPEFVDAVLQRATSASGPWGLDRTLARGGNPSILYTDTGLVAGTTYYYRAKGLAVPVGAGVLADSDWSAVVSATAATAVVAPVLSADPAYTPEHGPFVTLSFSLPPGTTRILVFRATATGPFAQLGSAVTEGSGWASGETSGSTNDFTASPDRTYRYYVVADAAGMTQSPPSNTATVTTAPTP